MCETGMPLNMLMKRKNWYDKLELKILSTTIYILSLPKLINAKAA